jgi:tRNA (cmo5U34)-methyltransferase
MDTTKERFEKLSKEYDEKITKIIPYYHELVKALINSIPFNKQDKIKILDLGCGTGTITKKIKERFPNSYITSLDLVEDMIEIAKIKLKDYENIEFVVGDFSTFDFDNEYDAIVSSLAIHHIKEDSGKIDLFKKIFNSLKENGVFYNSDVLLGNSKFSQNINTEIFKNILKKNFNEEEIKEFEKNAKAIDYPSTLIDQLKWLEEVGFKDIDITLKYYGHGVYGGRK